MKKKSTLSLSTLSFTDYDRYISGNPCTCLGGFDFGPEHDFLLYDGFAGIAVELRFSNLRYPEGKGTRRSISLLLFDDSNGRLVYSRHICVSIPAILSNDRIVVVFPDKEISYRSRNSYTLQVRDDNANVLLNEGRFHTYSVDQLGDPTKWYQPIAAGIIMDGKDTMMKSFDAYSEPARDTCIRFELCDCLPGIDPNNMPSLKIHIHYPNNQWGETALIEPRAADNTGATYFVDYPLVELNRYRGVYYVELFCIDCLIAGFVFANDTDIEGSWTGDNLAPLAKYSEYEGYDVDKYDYTDICRRYNESVNSNEDQINIVADESFDQLLEDFIAPQNTENDENILAELDDLTGLRSVKEKVITYDKIMRFSMLRAAKGLELFHTPLHAMFLGSPGTGKTTVAKLMGKMLKKAGVLSSGHIVMKERSTLLGQYYNSEAEKTLEAIEQAQGGILFIDEAHSLFQANDPKDPGKFVIEALLTALADPQKDDWMLILAGYPDEMKRLFEINPGFKSRIPESNIYTFEDFSKDELMEIAEHRLEKLDFTLSPDAKEALCRRLASDYAHRDRNFGNARHVMNLIHTEILPSMAVRVMDANLTDRRSLSEIQPSDIPMSLPATAPRRKPVGFTFSSAS